MNSPKLLIALYFNEIMGKSITPFQLSTPFYRNFLTPPFQSILGNSYPLFRNEGGFELCYRLLPSCKKWETYWWPVSEKMYQNWNFWHLIPLNPVLKVFLSKLQLCHLFQFFDHLDAKFQKKLMGTNGLTDQQEWWPWTQMGKPRAQK